MPYAIKDFQPTIGAGLGTWTYTVPVEGIYSVQVFSVFSVPSGLIITVNQNGSPVGPTPTTTLPASQGDINLQARIGCAAGDIITVVLSDATAQDATVPTIKTIINVHMGF